MIKIKSGLEMRYFAAVVIVMFLSVSAISVFAEEPRTQKGYTYNLKRLIDEAKKTVKEIDDELEKEEIEKRNRQREAMVKKHFEKGETLYRKGKPKEAKAELLEAIRITKDPEMESYVKESERKAMEEKRTREKKERKRKRQLEAERREKERLEREKKRKLEAEKREKARLEAKKAREEELARKKEAEARKRELLKEERERPRLERKKRRQLQAEQREKARLEKARLRKEELARRKEEPARKKEEQRLEAEKKKAEKRHLKKGKALYKKRKWKEAITEYRKALAIEPDNKKALRFIKRANTKLKRSKNK